MQVYEALVDLYISGDGTDTSVERKRLLHGSCEIAQHDRDDFFSGQSLPLGEAARATSSAESETFARSLNWYTTASNLNNCAPKRDLIKDSRACTRKRNARKELLRTLRELPGPRTGNATLEAPADFSQRSSRLIFRRTPLLSNTFPPATAS